MVAENKKDNKKTVVAIKVEDKTKKDGNKKDEKEKELVEKIQDMDREK